MVIGIFKVGPPEDRGESSRFFRSCPREDRFWGICLYTHVCTEVAAFRTTKKEMADAYVGIKYASITEKLFQTLATLMVLKLQ